MARTAFSLAFTSLVVAVALGGCSDEDDGPDLTGVWQVTSHTENDAGCSVGPAVTDPPFIKFTREEIFGQKYFQYVPCADAAGVDCEPSSGLFGLAYAEPIENGHKSVSYFSSSSGTMCILGGTISTAIVGDDGALAIETRLSSLELMLPEAECTTDEALKRLEAGTLPCETLETLAAVRN